MKKKYLLLIPVVLVVAAAAFVLASYRFVGGQVLKKGQSAYDLRGKNLSLADYEAIRTAFPNAEIFWNVPFQGDFLPEDTTEVTLKSQPAGDVEALKKLPALRTIHAEGYTDYQGLLVLGDVLPGVEIIYEVPVSGTAVSSQDTSATVTDASAAELMQKLRWLPGLKTLKLEGKLPDPSEMADIIREYPDIAFGYEIRLGDTVCRSDAESLDLLNSSVTAGELKDSLPRLVKVKTITLPESFSQEEAVALADEFSGVFFVFPYTIGEKTFSTDAEEIDISETEVTVQQAEGLLSCFRNLKKVIMSGCGISNEEMDALNRRHEDVSFVWTVKIAGVDYRTDMRYFYPWQQHISHMINLDCSNLRYCTEMEVIDIGHYWVTDCSFLEYTPHIKYLILAMTGCRDITPVKYLQELEYLEIFEMIVDDYTPLLECKALRDLNVGLTYADPTPLTQMTWLENLYWYGGDDYLRGIGFDFDWEKGLPNTNVELTLNRNGDKEWRYLPRYYLMRDILNTGYLNQYAARTIWEDDIDAIMDCKLNPDMAAEEVIGEIIARRKANGEYIPGIKNSGPLNDIQAQFLGRPKNPTT